MRKARRTALTVASMFLLTVISVSGFGNEPGRDAENLLAHIDPQILRHFDSKSTVVAVRFSPDGKRIALVRGNGTVEIVSTATLERTARLFPTSFRRCPATIEFDGRGGVVVVDETGIRILKEGNYIYQSEPLKKWEGNVPDKTSISQRGRIILAVKGSIVYLYEGPEWARTEKVSGIHLDGRGGPCAVSPDGSLVACAVGKGVEVRGLKGENSLLGRIKRQTDCTVEALRFSPTGRHLVVVFSRPTFRYFKEPPSDLKTEAFTPYGYVKEKEIKVVILSTEGNVNTWEDTLERISQDGPVHASFTRDGDYLFLGFYETGGEPKTEVYRLDSSLRVGEIRGFSTMAASRDWLAGASRDWFGLADLSRFTIICLADELSRRGMEEEAHELMRELEEVEKEADSGFWVEESLRFMEVTRVKLSDRYPYEMDRGYEMKVRRIKKEVEDLERKYAEEILAIKRARAEKCRFLLEKYEKIFQETVGKKTASAPPAVEEGASR